MLNEVARVIERERHDRGGVVERCGERICVKIRYDVIHREGTFRQVAKFGELAAELVGGAVPRADAAEGSGVGDGRSQRG
jgi:hypothetical protein